MNWCMLLLCCFSLLLSPSIGQTTTCDASNDCSSSTITDDGIFCQGAASCYESDLTAETSDIQCSSLFSCATSSGNSHTYLVTARSETYCSGQFSCQYTRLEPYNTGITTYLYCSGQQSCDNSDISGYDLIECSSKYSCNGARISKSDRLQCDGYQACQLSTISNIDTKLQASGNQSLIDAYVVNATVVDIFGYQGLLNGKIESGSLSDMTVNIYGYKTGMDGTIICNGSITTVTCNINCLSNTGCDDLTVLCVGSFSTCNVDCDPTVGIGCPIGYFGPSPSPTSNPLDNPPTFNPSINPSILPTYIPSVSPTNNPSIIPTNLPSNDPTIRPTDAPTVEPTHYPTDSPTPPTPNPTPKPTNSPSLPTLAPTQPTVDSSGSGGGSDSSSSDTFAIIGDNGGVLALFLVLLLFLIFSCCCSLYLYHTKGEMDKKYKRNLIELAAMHEDGQLQFDEPQMKVKKSNDNNGPYVRGSADTETDRLSDGDDMDDDDDDDKDINRDKGGGAESVRF